MKPRPLGRVASHIVFLGIIFGTFTGLLQEMSTMIAATRNGDNRSFLSVLLFAMPGGLVVYPDLVKHVVLLFVNPFLCMQLIACADLMITPWHKHELVKKGALWVGLLPCVGFCYMMYCIFWKLHALISSLFFTHLMMGAGIAVLELPFLPILLVIPVTFLYTFYERQEKLLTKT